MYRFGLFLLVLSVSALSAFGQLQPTINDLAAAVPGLSQAVAPVNGLGFTLTVNGNNFVAGAQISFGTSVLNASSVTNSQLTLAVPASVLTNPGNLQVKVVNPGGEQSNAITFSVIERGDINASRTLNIGDALVTALFTGGVRQPPLPESVGDINLSGSTNIGDALVLALFAGGSNPNLPQPEITSVSPNPVNRGETLSISGSGFSSTNTNLQVLFTTTTGTIRVVPDAGSTSANLTVTVPPNAVSGVLEVFRLDAAMGSSEYPVAITSTSTPVVLTSIVPFNHVASGSSVVLAGMGFSSTTTDNIVLFPASAGGTVAGTVTAATPTRLTVNVPSGAGCGGVTVTVSGATSKPRDVVVSGTTCIPHIDALLGGGNPGDTVVLEGAGFDVTTPANNLVTFPTATGVATAPVVMAGATQLQVRIPDNAIGNAVNLNVGRLNIWTKTTNGEWTDPAAWSRGVVPASTDLVLIDKPGVTVNISNGTNSVTNVTTNAGSNLVLSGGSLSVSSSSALYGSFTMNGGTLSGTGDWNLYALTWNGGSMSGPGTTRIPVGQVAHISTASSKNLTTRTLTNNGTIIQTGTLGVISGAVINNLSGAIFDLAADVGFTNFGGATSTFNNAGTLKKSAGTGTSAANGLVLTNSGLVDTQTGTLAVNGGTNTGTYNVAASATLSESGGTFNVPQFNGTGTVSLNGTTVMNGDYTFAGTTVLGSGTTTFNGKVTFPGTQTIGGTVLFNDVTSLDTLNLSGTLSGSGAVTLNQLNWTAGTIGGTGPFDIVASALISGGVSKSLSIRTLTNHGTVTQTATLGVLNGAVINNLPGSVYDLAADVGFTNFGGATSTFSNAGTLKKSAGSGTSSTNAMALNNSGLIDVQTGTLAISAPGTNTGTYNIAPSTTLSGSGGTFNVPQFTGTGTLSLNGTTVLNGDYTFAGTTVLAGGTTTFNGKVTFAGTQTIVGTVNFNDVTSLDTLNLSGILSGSGAVTLNQLNWTAGTLGGTGTLDIAAAGSAVISGGVSKSLSSRTLNNHGTVTQTATLGVLNGAVINNLPGSVFDLAADVGFTNFGGATSRLNNEGTLKKSAGTGTSNTTGLVLNNSGLVDAQTGALTISSGTNSGTFNIASSATLNESGGTFNVPQFTGTGTLSLNGTTVLNGDYTFAGTTVLGSGTTTFNGKVTFPGTQTIGGTVNFNDVTSLDTLNLSGTLSGSGAVTLNQLNWTAGTIGGTGPFDIVASALISGGVSKSLSIRTLTNHGTVTQTATLGVLNGAVINNLSGSVYDLAADVGFTNFGGATSTFSNAGTLKKSAGSGTSSTNAMALNNSGLIDVQTGTLAISAPGTNTGTYNIAPSTTLSGSGGTFNVPQFTGTGTLSLNGTTVLNGDYTFAGTTVLAGGTTTFNGKVTFAGTQTIVGTVNFNDVTSLDTLNLSGILSGSGAVTVNQLNWTAGTLGGTGTLDIAAAGSAVISGGVSKSLSSRTLNNHGTVTQTATLGVLNGAVINNLPGSVFDLAADVGFTNFGGATSRLNNEGTLKKSAGTGTSNTTGLVLNNSGLVDAQTGALTISSGTNSGTFNIASSATLNESGGTFNVPQFTGTGTLSLNGTTVLNGDYTFAGTTVLGSGTTTFNGKVTFPGTQTIGGTVLFNDVTSLDTLNLSGTLSGSGAVTLNQLNWTAGTIGGTGPFDIVASALISGGVSKSLSIRTLTNHGTVTQTATLGVLNGAVINNLSGSVYDLAADVGFTNFGGATSTFSNSGLLKKSAGTGTSSLSLTLNNSGTLNVATGIVNPTTYSEPGSTSQVVIAIGGTSPGTQFSRLQVGGVATFAGGLTVNLVNGYVPNLSDTFAIITYNSATGAFSQTSGFAFAADKKFVLTKNATNITLTVVPGP